MPNKKPSYTLSKTPIEKFHRAALHFAGRSALVVALFSCNQTQNPTQIIAPENTLTINTTAEHFTKGNSFDLQVQVKSAVEVSADVSLTAPPEVQLDQTLLHVNLAAGEKKTLTVPAKLLEAGYYNITIGATAQGWQGPLSDQLGFNVEEAANNRSVPVATRAAALVPSGKESLEDHIKNLPVVTDQSIHVEQVKADLENRRNVRNDYIQKGITFKQADGSVSKPQDIVIGYLRGTGSGQPLPGELDGVKPQTQTASGKVSPRSWCGSHAATVHFDIRHTTIRYTTLRNAVFPLKGYHVRVMDDNGILGPAQIAEGELDANGNFAYQQPNCDSWSPFWGDWSPPDVFYYVEARIPNSPTAGFNDAIRIVNTLGTQYFVQTGTTWEDSGSSHSYNLSATNTWSDNFMWLAKMFQLAQDFNVAAGGTKIGFAAFWPATVVQTNWQAYAPIARVVMGGATWESPDPAVHEFGHNLRYSVSNPTWFSQCLGATLPCDPGFGSGIVGLDYNHTINSSITGPQALNEGFADYFYEMTRDYYARNGTDYLPNNWGFYNTNCNTVSSCSSYVPTGAGSEARVSSFLYQYTTKLIAPVNGRGNTAAFGIVRDSLKDTGTFNQGFYDVWNNYFKKSYTSLDSAYLNPCTTGTVVNKTYAVSCLLTNMTLTEQAVILP
jgi:hypothetical protein